MFMHHFDLGNCAMTLTGIEYYVIMSMAVVTVLSRDQLYCTPWECHTDIDHNQS